MGTGAFLATYLSGARRAHHHPGLKTGSRHAHIPTYTHDLASPRSAGLPIRVMPTLEELAQLGKQALLAVNISYWCRCVRRVGPARESQPRQSLRTFVGEARRGARRTAPRPSGPCPLERPGTAPPAMTPTSIRLPEPIGGTRPVSGIGFCWRIRSISTPSGRAGRTERLASPRAARPPATRPTVTGPSLLL